MKIDCYHGLSDVGLARLNNEDVWAFCAEENLFLLADGIGGHLAGEVAAREAVLETIRYIKEDFDPDLPTQSWEKKLDDAITYANTHVHQMAQEEKGCKGMGTTLCAALLVDQVLIIAHIGDSRIYRFRKGRLTCLTSDHSLKNQMIASGKLCRSEEEKFPKNVITRAIGTHLGVKPEVQTLNPQDQDLYFLCSDGLTDPLCDRTIASILDEATTLAQACQSLIYSAKESGGGDNITIVMFSLSSA